MARWWRALAALPEDRGVIPSTTWWLASISNTSTLDPMTPFWLLWPVGSSSPHSHIGYRYMEAGDIQLKRIFL